jgi:hypothetical protein
MKRTIAIVATVVGFYSATHAMLPIQDMSKYSIGIDYSGMWRGEEITKQNIPGHESAHHLNVHYAPLPYLQLSVGFGAASFSVDTFTVDTLQRQFKGTYNFSPSLGISAYSPFLLKKLLRVTAGVKAYFLYSRNKEKSFVYSGPLVNPSAGAIVSLGEYIDIEAGVRGNIIFGRMQQMGGAAVNFSNGQTVRTYLSAMMHTPSEGAYFIVDFDASPNIDLDWSKGPAESSIGISVGLILRQSKDKLAKKMIDDPSFPGYKNLQKKTEEMEKEMK